MNTALWPAQLESAVLHAVPIGLRVAAMMTFTPVLGSAAIPFRIKAVLTVVITALLYPVCRIPEIVASPGAWTRIALSEIGLGLAIGLAVQFVLEGAQLAGQIIGFQFAFSLVNIIDPQTNVDTPVLSILHQLMGTLFFLVFNVHHWILRGLVASFDYVPPGSVAVTAGTVEALMRAASGMWLAGVQIALPLLLVTLLIDVTVGFLSKASPQIPVLTLSVPLKSAVGYVVLGVAAAAWPGFFERHFISALGWGERILHLAR